MSLSQMEVFNKYFMPEHVKAQKHIKKSIN